MRRIDSKSLPFDSGSDIFGELGDSRAHSPQSEQLSGAHPLGDFAEPGCHHWENAWIDLGGEG